MRILILNWRCPRHPRAGGAEIVTHEVARRLVALGDTVEWFSASATGLPSEEEFDGVHFVRAGRQSTVHLEAFRRYHGRLAGRFDAVVDEVNTIPFFTPLWAGVPTIMFIHQLAREVWWYESRFPINAIGYLVEPVYLRCYRNVPVLTVSESTKSDLRRLGFKGVITVMPEGLESVAPGTARRSINPTYIYVGRLSPSKRVHHIIRAFALANQHLDHAELWLVGDGPLSYLEKLRKLVQRLALTGQVRFWGRVSPAQKHDLMRAAHGLLMASIREGWGLVIQEANACGTPAVVYDVPGLRDAVRPDLTGLVVNPSPRDLSVGMVRLFQDPALFNRLVEGALEWSREFSYDKSAYIVREAVASALEAAGPHNRMWQRT